MGWNNYTVTNSYQGGANPIDSISISETYEPDFVYQRDGAGNATAEFIVNYTSPPVDLYFRLLDAEDDSVVVDWTVFDTVMVEGSGTSALSITRPSSTTYYKVEVRLGTNGLTSIQSDAWAVGIKVGFIGQSLIEHLGTQDQSGTPSHVRKFTVANGFFVSTVGAGQAECAKRLVEIHGCVVAICNTAVGDTVLTEEAAATGNRGSNYWNNPNSSLWLNTIDALERFAPDGRVEFVAWMQGGSDATQGVDYGIYENDLREFLLRVRSSFLDKSGGNEAPIVIGTLGRSGSSTDANRQGIRTAIYNVIEDDSTLLPIPIYPYGTDDRTHPNDAGDLAIGLSIANVSNGERAPRFSANSIEGNTVTVTYDQDLLTSDTNYSAEGVRVEVNGSPAGVSSFTRSSARQAEIALNSTPYDVSDISIYVCYGSGTGSDLLTYPKSASNGLFALPVISENNDFSETINQPPTANAGPDQSVAAATQFTLDGTGSQDTDGTIIEYRWTQTAGDTVTLNLDDPARPTAKSPSKTTAQRLTFQLITVDDEGAESSPGTVNIDVAAFAVSEMLKLLDTRQWTVVNDGSVQAFEGRSNREAFRFLVTPSDGIQTSAEGYFLFDQPGVHAVEVISTPTSKISSVDDPYMIRGDVIAARIGDLQTDENGNLTLTFVLYVTDDKDGLVMTAKVIEPYQKASYFRKQG